MSSGTVLLGHVAHLRTAALVAPDLPLARLGRCGDATAAQRISRIHVPRCRSTSMHPSREAQSSVVLLTSTRLLASPSLATPRVFRPCLPPLCTAPIRLFPGRASPFPSFPTATHHRSTPTTCHSSSRPTSSSVLARGARCLLLRTTVLISVALPLSPSKLLLLSGATLWSGVLRVPRVL